MRQDESDTPAGIAVTTTHERETIDLGPGKPTTIHGFEVPFLLVSVAVAFPLALAMAGHGDGFNSSVWFPVLLMYWLAFTPAGLILCAVLFIAVDIARRRFQPRLELTPLMCRWGRRTVRWDAVDSIARRGRDIVFHLDGGSQVVMGFPLSHDGEVAWLAQRMPSRCSVATCSVHRWASIASVGATMASSSSPCLGPGLMGRRRFASSP